jgi:hypothetical protein
MRLVILLVAILATIILIAKIFTSKFLHNYNYYVLIHITIFYNFNAGCGLVF